MTATRTEVSRCGKEPAAVSHVALVRLGQMLLAVSLLIAWYWGAVRLGPNVLARPDAVAARIGTMILSKSFYGHLFATASEALGGLLLGGAVGIAAPLLLRFSPRATDAILPFIRAAMGIPKLALTPVLILWFGLGILSKIVLIALITFFILFEAAFAGLRSIDGKHVRMIRILGATERQVTREVIVNSLRPFIFAGLKTALPWSVSAAVVGELLASQAGLGYLIGFSRDVGDVTGVCAGVVVVTALVLALDAGLSTIQTRSLRWQPIDGRTSL
jgi:NitT/TauT family transport system permease protein